MSRKQKIYGMCRLCGENKELTFEHVPPETVFNKGAVRNVTLDAVIKDTVKKCNTIFSGDYRTKGEVAGSADGKAQIGETTTKG